MKLRQYLDIHDRDVTPVVYHFLWSLVYPTPNDLIHEIFLDEEFRESQRYEFDTRIKKANSYCYSDQKEIKKLQDRPALPTFDEAIEEYKQWLQERGANPEDSVLVKMWW